MLPLRLFLPITLLLHFPVFAGRRRPFGRSYIIDEMYDNPFAQSKRVAATVSTLLSEFIVTDKVCGLRKSNCPRYCRNDEFGPMFCEIDCQDETVSLPLVSCRDPRYDPTERSGSKLIDSNWRQRLSFTRTMIGDVRSDLLPITQWAFEPNRVTLIEATFVSARWFDVRALRQAETVVGLKPGPYSVVPQFLKHINASKLFLNVVLHSSLDPLRHPPEPMVVLDLGLGLIDRAHCVAEEEFIWVHTEGDIILRAPKVNFMGVEFENVEIVFDLAEEAFVISANAAARLRNAGIIWTFYEQGSSTIFQYNCSVGLNAQFFDADNRLVLALDTEDLTFGISENRCLSQLGRDVSDPDVDSRYAEVWHMGFFFLRKYCLAYDYATNMIGIGRRRQWGHPAPYVWYP